MKKIRIVQLIVLAALVYVVIVLSSCGKSSLTPIEDEKHVQFVIESNDRFNAVYGVNDNIHDKYVYTTEFISGRFSVSNNDTLHVSAYSADTAQLYTFSIISDGDTLFKNNAPITIIF